MLRSQVFWCLQYTWILFRVVCPYEVVCSEAFDRQRFPILLKLESYLHRQLRKSIHTASILFQHEYPEVFRFV